MTRKGLAVAAAAVVLLAVAAYYVRQKDVREGKHKTAELVFPYNTGRVAELTVQVGDRRATLVRGSGGVWEAVAGSRAETRPGLTADVVGAWGRIRFLDVVEEEPGDLVRYGLDEPKVRLVARIKAEAESTVPARPPELELGAPNPMQPSYYARVDGFPRVVLVTAQAAEVENLARRLLGLPADEVPEGRAGSPTPAG